MWDFVILNKIIIMLVFLTVLIALVCVLLMVVVLIQNPKGGGLDATFGGSSATKVLGAARSTDFMEKFTWYLAGALFVLCLLTSLLTGVGDKGGSDVEIRTNPTGQIEYQEDINDDFYYLG